MIDTIIEPFLIKDSRIENISPIYKFGVFSGANQNTYQQFPSTSANTNHISFNCPIPSIDTVIDRTILIQATYKIKLTISNVTKDASAFNYGLGECFQAFPLNSSFKNVNCTINNTTLSVNSQNILQLLLKLIDYRELQKYNGMCPTLCDLYFNNYTNTIGTKADITGDYRSSGFDNCLLPRGSHPLKSIVVNHYIGGKLTDTSLKSTGLTDTWTIYLESEFTEPLIISPFLLIGKRDFNNQGLVGISNINFVFNLDNSLKRFFTTNNSGDVSISFAETDFITNAKLLFNFMNIQETDNIPQLNAVPYLDYPVYISSDTGLLAPNNQKNIISQTFTLNQIPDLIIICVRKPIHTMTIKNTNFILPIRNISLNFNNNASLLSSATPQDLWRLSKINGSIQTWYEFYGYAGRANPDITNTDINQYLIATNGSLLVINPAKDLGLEYNLSNGSIGNYNIQFKLDIINNTTETFIPEIVLLTINSGVLINENDFSTTFTGLLNTDMVLETVISKTSIPHANYNRTTDEYLDIETSNKLDSLLK